MRRLDRAQRADRRLVGLDEHAAHVRVGGEHVLRELEGLVGGVGLHLLQAGFLGDAGLLHRVAEARGARLAVLARLRDRDEADRAVRPALLLHRRGERLADAIRALIIVGDDERDIFAAVGADVGDDDRDLRARGEREHARRGRAVGRRDRDAGDAARDGVLRVLELGLRAVVRSRARCRSSPPSSLPIRCPSRDSARTAGRDPASDRRFPLSPARAGAAKPKLAATASAATARMRLRRFIFLSSQMPDHPA